MTHYKAHHIILLSTVLAVSSISAVAQSNTGANKAIITNNPHVFTKTIIASNVATKAGASNAPLQITAKRAVPIGFESLTAPQSSAVDIYYSGRYITTARASFTNTKITFREPKKLIALIPDIENTEELLQALSGEIDTNSADACNNSAQTDCGILKPAVASLIFDETSFRVDLFINSAYRSVQGPNVERYLPESNSGFSLLQNFGSALSKQSASTSDYSLYGKTAFSYRESSIQTNWDISQDNRSSIDSLFFQRDYRGRELRSGLFRSQSIGLNYSSDHKLAGLRYASSQNTLIDQGLSQSSDIQIFLQQRAQIDILKDGKLVSSGFYEAGNQLIDSRALPSGAYDVTLKIYQDSGPATLETHFFVKELALPPKSEKQFFFEAGQVALEQDSLLPKITDSWLARGGISWRHKDDLGIQLTLATSNNNSFFESGLVSIGRKHRSNLSVLASIKGDYGLSINSRWNIKQLTAVLDIRELRRSSDRSNEYSNGYLNNDNEEHGSTIDPLYPPYNDLAFEQASKFYLLPSSFSQHRVTINYRLKNNQGNIQFSASFNKRGHYTRRFDNTLSYSRTIKQRSNDNLQFNVSLSKSDDMIMGLIGVTWQMNAKSWSHSILPESRFSNDSTNDEPNGHQVSLYSSWRKEGTTKGDIKIATRATGGTQGQNSLAANTEYRSNFGSFSGQIERSFSESSNGQAGTRLSANASTSFITNFNNIAWGGRQQAGSALLVDINGDAKDTTFDVYINDQRRGLAHSNDTTVIQLAPFQTYSVYLRPRKSELVNYQNRQNQITLYPGNVIPLQWEANKIHIGFGKILDADGNAIKNAKINGAIGYATTDDYGFFQAEVSQAQVNLQVSVNGQQCTIKLPKSQNIRNGIAKYGNLSCL